ncbi:MAG: FkbM family methyltransferase [Nitrososphaerota archaeon]|jgi:thiol-disulfide isomerase/thioredoxin|nr:FkbM family methyltransferase [Nitrososphaerota archaeon]
MTNIIKKLYYKSVPYAIRIKIKKIRHREEINFSDTYFKYQETHFKCHMTDSVYDDTRKTDILRIFSFLRKNGLNMFPDMDSLIHEKYFTRKLKIEKDSNTGLFYVLVDNKKLFYKPGMTENSVKYSFNGVSFEQDFASPHRYLSNDNYFVGVIESDTNQISSDDFGINEGDVVVDVGAGEGNFALSIIEKVSKVYIIESDAEWCEALKQTFLPYKEKVEIIQKYLSDINDDNNITLTSLIEKYNINKIDFLKMDIEGYEKQALRGGTINDTKFANINKMAICTYHNPEDETEISNFVSQYGYKFHLTDGYIVVSDLNSPPSEKTPFPIRKGVLRAYKQIS